MKEEIKEKRILRISFFVGLLFAVMEFFFAIYSHSQSSLTDAVYDASELVFIALILFMTPLFHKPITEKHPYGFYQVETIFLLVKGIMMTSVTFGISAQVIQSIIHGGNMVDGGLVSAFQLLLGSISLVVYLVMKKMNQSLSSPTVDAEILGWKMDVGYSFGLSAAFFISTYLEKTSLAFIAPYFDQIVAVAVMLFMLPEMVKMLRDTVKELFLFGPDEETMDKIKSICQDVLENTRFTPKFYDVTKTGRHMWLAIYYSVEDDFICVSELNKTIAEINKAVSEEFENCSCEMIIDQPDIS